MSIQKHFKAMHGTGTDNTLERPTNEFAIDLRRVTKQFEVPAGLFTALTDIDLQVEYGEFVAIVGKSGSGKSTLLNMLTGIDTPSSGEVYVAGSAVHRLSQNQSAIWRGTNVGMVFQFFQLLPTLTIAENIMLPMDFCKTYPKRERKARAIALLDQVGIADQANKLPALLSGGQQQRVAIARSLANDPPVIVADEPTGNLDSATADGTLALFQSLAENGKTVLMVTHERDVTRWVSRTVTLADGVIIDDSILPNRPSKGVGPHILEVA
ncbi:MAG: ABC transporter ATP-binding protein [Anaerolineae bacterium]